MRQGLNERRVNGQDWVKKIRQSDAVGLRNEAQHRAIPIEAPRAPDRNNLDSRFTITVKEFAPQASGGVFVSQLNDGRSVPSDIDDCYEAVRQDSSYRCTSGQFFKACHCEKRMTMLETPGRKQSLVGYYTTKITLLKQVPPIRPVLWGG